MCSTDKIKKFSYRLFYFSRNLEHVIFDEQNPNDEDKFLELDNFLNGLTVTIEDYLIEQMQDLNSESFNEKYKRELGAYCRRSCFFTKEY
ncbi:hypothetical protein KHA80_06300 [Anaerobacillus sp. HL2]|nr:hypothetical protein KHA80_06300 [Anaerobacillus sp. HL2]